MKFPILIGILLYLAASGCCSENLALNKPTAQSASQILFEASPAVDGDRNHVMNDGSCTFSTPGTVDPYSWWVVDLGDVYRVSHITIARREVNFNLNDLHFELFMGMPTMCSNSALCTYIATELDFPLHNVTCDDSNAAGRYLRIRHTSGTKEISLCECEVYGEKVNSGAEATSDCSGPKYVNRRADHGLTGDDVIFGNATSAVACAKECISTGACAAYSFSTDLSQCEYAAGAANVYVQSRADWLTYDLC